MLRPIVRAWRSAAILLLLFAAAAARAQSPVTFLVGADEACDYATIQQAVDAAATIPGPDFIHVARNGVYGAQAIKIGGQDLEIIGGFDTCADATAEGGTTLSGAGGAADSVVQIRGGGLRRLRNLVITDGDEANDSYGGGIDYQGTGAVELVNVAVIGNRAGYGGGISVDNSGGRAILELKAPTVVNGNTAANDGGGIHLRGSSDLYMIEDQTMVGGNHAPNGQGGGIFVQGPAIARIASPGYGGAGAISGNDARDGGGMALRANRNDSVEASFTAIDVARPVRVEGNSASGRGGAFYASGYSTAPMGSSFARLSLDKFAIEANSAPYGAVLYLDSDSDLFGLEFGSSASLGYNVPGSARCDPGIACNLVRGNVATAPDGGTFHVDSSSQVTVTRATVVGNAGANLVRLVGESGDTDDSTADFVDSVIADNVATEQLLRGTGPIDRIRLEQVTVANNAIGAQHVIGFAGSNGKLRIVNSIVSQPGRLTLQHPGGPSDPDVEAGKVIATDVSTLPTGDAVVEAPARFVDPANGDYRLRAGSPAVDFAPPVAGDQRDLVDYPRDQDYGLHPDFLGTRDLGALEHQSQGNLVLNDRFASDLRIWRNLDPDWTRWSSLSDDAGSGSLEINVPGLSGLASFTGASQCIHLPGPGTYTLDGRGYAGALNPQFLDRLSIEWVLRGNSDACQGPALSQGELGIRAGTGWKSPLASAQFAISPTDWNLNSTVELRLTVRQNPNNPAVNALFGRFDGLSLTGSSSFADELLADGFE